MKKNLRLAGRQGRLPLRRNLGSSGFSHLELMIVVFIMGLMMAVLAPTWLGLADGQSLNHAQDGVFQTMRSAQQQAIVDRVVMQASFRETNHQIEAAVHPANALVNQIPWQPLSANAEIDIPNTTLYQSSGIYRIQFNEKGGINSQLGRLTLKRGNRSLKRCVVSSTLLGVIRKATNQDCNH